MTRSTDDETVRERIMRTAIICIGIALLAGCNWPGAETDQAATYATTADDPNRDTQAAIAHNTEAMRLMKLEHYDQAERELKLALSADRFYGPAHNNLGSIYLRDANHYEAAWEFEYAAKLMPNKAEPVYNLGMVYEEIGDMDQAAAHYRQALELSPDNVEVLANLARIHRRQSRKDQETRLLLQQDSRRDRRPEWRNWAHQQLALIGHPTPEPPIAMEPTE